MTTLDPMEAFRLRPVKAARVSEISETTAASPVAPEERVNFHIGNPIQDERLVAWFFRAALGLEPEGEGSAPEKLIEEWSGEPEERPALEFLLRLIRKSAPYMPRGGFLRASPHPAVTRFLDWFQTGQPDTLTYDLGATSGAREIILVTGGIAETFRVLLHALNHSLVTIPARFYIHRLNLPEHLFHFPNIPLTPLPDGEHEALQALDAALREERQKATFLALGSEWSEEGRRLLRQRASESPLVIVEANDAPNSRSLAREARMRRRVLRFLSAGVLRPELRTLPTMVVAGDAEMVGIMEIAHFQLKGTPSAPEVEHLDLLLRSTPEPMEASGLRPPEARSLLHAARTENGNTLDGIAATTERLTGERGQLRTLLSARWDEAAERVGGRIDHALGRWTRRAPLLDPLLGHSFTELLHDFVRQGTNPLWQKKLSQAFLSAFLNHHPEYRSAESFVVSGSSRTALALIGFHCGIREVVIPDLSWTYEHCFPAVKAVPLTGELELDVDAMIAAVQERIAGDPSWRFAAAVALNNPHNATGQAFDPADVRRLCRWLLRNHILVFDDLAYQEVLPSEELRGPASLRQIADDLQRTGEITEEDASYVVPVHSLSKTDCLAGSRLAVVEIRNERLRERFRQIHATVVPNVAAMFLSYLFYRRETEMVRGYWRLRNAIFQERMLAIEEASANLPPERNRFAIRIRRPAGSMYPLMIIGNLPSGVSLDWLASGLARQGIGLLPLSAFARTEVGYETGRNTFRLTLGGVDGSERLYLKTRRVLIDMNRMLAEEESRYHRQRRPRRPAAPQSPAERARHAALDRLIEETTRAAKKIADAPFCEEVLPERLELLRRRAADRLSISLDLLKQCQQTDGSFLSARLERELYKDSLSSRQERFRKRLFDRTVHPTQMYSIDVELLWERGMKGLLESGEFPPQLAAGLASALAAEYRGMNVAVASAREGDELLLDLSALCTAEELLEPDPGWQPGVFLSYWGDWDGSTRPSGQGHQLIASVLLENLRRLAGIVRALVAAGGGEALDQSLIEEANRLESGIRRFRTLLAEINTLTHHLERRYRGVLPAQITPGAVRRLGMRLHLASDPLTSLWQHNDRLERRMVGLREKRRHSLAEYFRLNKAFRKGLHSAIPAIAALHRNPHLTLRAAAYRDLLQRVAITPRIHQKMITAQDQFAIDTTVHNIAEINAMGGATGNPGMILALQVSMSTSPEALITLDRKLRAREEEILRTAPESGPAPVWIVPLFEDLDAVARIPSYLSKVWDHAVQTRPLAQNAVDRFTEIIPEVFIAGSDLSQQIGQTAGTAAFREAKQQIVTWLAPRGLVGRVRIKLGSGEPMQRQGGYYAPHSGEAGFILAGGNGRRLASLLPAAAKKSVEYATTPVMGIFAAADLRTVQSNLAERLRFLPAEDYAELLTHVRMSQRFYERELARAAEPLFDTRLQFTARGQQELDRLTIGTRDPVMERFVKLSTENFRRILFGETEDVVGIHIFSYFIARTSPQLRDRPTVRPGRGDQDGRGERILEKIAETIPLAQHGSLLRAIAHNQAQTTVLGLNQLTTGLFRSFQLFSRSQHPEGDGALLLSDRILPHLPVYEILHSLRLFHDVDQEAIHSLERAIPAGNGAFVALREDLDALGPFCGILRQELIRRHGLAVADFFDGEQFHPGLLPTVRPDLAVLLQPDLFNADAERLFEAAGRPIPPEWEREVRQLLRTRETIQEWRRRAWNLLREPVFVRVESFVELALALASLAPGGRGIGEVLRGAPAKSGRQTRPAGGGDESMHQFLAAAFTYLSELQAGHPEVPTTVVRALKEVKRIIAIEEQALPPRQQEELRFCLLHIARLAGENG